MIGVDAHTHLLDGRFDPEMFVAGERLGILRFMCSNIGDYQSYPSLDEVRAMNRVLADEIQKYPGRLLGYCYVNPRWGTASLTDLRLNVEERGMIGMKLWVSTYADDALVDPLLEYAAERRLIVLAHAWRKTVGQLPFESTASHIAAAARRHPDVRFIMAHMGGQVESALNSIEEVGNVAVDTSGTIIGAGDVALAVKRLGSARVVFGSDLHHVDLGVNVGKVLGAHLAPAVEERVFGGTVASWLAGVKS